MPQIVFRGSLEAILRQAADLGYQGVDLFLETVDEINLSEIKASLDRYNLGVSMLAAPADMIRERLTMGDPDPVIRRRFLEASKRHLELAALLGAPIVIGFVRGSVKPGMTAAQVNDLFCESMVRYDEMVKDADVDLLLEPINRYEINTINTVDQALALINRVGSPRLRLMLDSFHMNIEEPSLPVAIWKAREHLRYFQLVDSNRLAPGWGHINMRELVLCLREIGYDGYLGIEVAPKPSPEEAARWGLDTISRLLDSI
jgi:sugar phosphate isomerase/epimerase